MKAGAVDRAWTLGREQFPGVAVTLAGFEAHVAAHAREHDHGEHEDVAHEDVPHGADLYLAYGCEAGDRAAHEHLAVVLRPVVRAVASRFAARGPTEDELFALLLERLLVKRAEGPARIASYDGSHALGAWVRVIALRLALDGTARVRPEQPLESAVLESLYAIGDPELIAQRSRDEVLAREAIGDACRSLDARSRRLLRHALVEGLTVDEIGALYDVHRATAARQVRRALDTLVEGARGALRGLGDPSSGDFSRIDLSLERWLRTTQIHAESA